MRQPKNIPTKKSKTFRIDSNVLHQVEAMAEEQNRTVNNMVETLLKDSVKRQSMSC